MSWIGVMVGASVGAASGGIMTGVNGGSTEDILKSVAIGGTLGGIGGGIGTAVSAPAAGAAAGGGAGGATGGGAGATVVPMATTAATTAPTATTAATVAPTATAAVAPQTASQGINQMLAQGATQTASQAPTQTASQGIGSMLGQSTSPAQMSVINPAANSTNIIGSQEAAKQAAQQFAMGNSSGGISTLPGQPGFVGPTATQGQIANAKAYTDANMGTRLLADAFGQEGNIVGNTGLKMAGSALQGGAMNAGLSGLMAGARGEDVGEGMAKGAATGMIGGAATGAMSGMDNAVGRFATEHPYITSGGIGLAANMALDKPKEDVAPTQPSIRANVKWNPSVYRPYGPQFAAGGITDLDNYDQSPQMQSPGTLDIPNRNEVSNNQGYMGDSVQMMAHGGISDLGGYSDGGRLLKGPGTGVSDDIPATIEGRQPARLAANEFVVPARIVSEIGNGSTDAGAKALYAMMDRVQKDRSKSMGKGKFAVDSKASRHLDDL